jgi:hypothetical protein
LRTALTRGIFPNIKKRFFAAPSRFARWALREDKTRIALTKKGFLVSNRVIAALLE